MIDKVEEPKLLNLLNKLTKECILAEDNVIEIKNKLNQINRLQQVENNPNKVEPIKDVNCATDELERLVNKIVEININLQSNILHLNTII